MFHVPRSTFRGFSAFPWRYSLRPSVPGTGSAAARVATPTAARVWGSRQGQPHRTAPGRGRTRCRSSVMTGSGSGIEGLASGMGGCGLGDARPQALAVLSRQPEWSGDTGPCVSLSLSCRVDNQSGSQRQPLSGVPAPPPASLVSSRALTLPGSQFIFYMGHLEALRVMTITGERLGLLNWIYWGVLFFPSLKDPFIGQNQFQTASMALAGLTRHRLSLSPST